MKIFRDISNYSKKRKLLLVEAIEKINWDTNYNPQEFLALLTGSQADKKWALTKMLAYMPYIRVRQLLTKEFLRESVTEEMIDTIYPPMRREEIFRVYRFCLGENIIKRKTMKEEKNINLNGDIYGVGVAQEGSTVNQDIHLPPHIIPKVLTKQTGLANDIDFVGRKEELQKVDELLNQNSMLLLLNGIGGIGKSTLASYYLNQHKDNFDYYGFVQVNEDIKLSLASAFGTSLDLKSEKIDDLFAEIMNKLQNLKGKKLLIIDDVKEMDNQQDEMNMLMTLKNSGFQILFTSRETKEYIPQYFLDIMTIEDARKLFLKYYFTDEMDKVDKILGYLDSHTLFIEITAKTLTKRKNTLSLDIVIEKFENGEFSTVKRNKSESFNKFLKNFSYDSVMLTQKKNLLFLKRLSVLPSIEISFEDLYKFLVCEDNERLEDFLIELVDNGWLIESEHSYKFHQILKEFVWDNYLPLFEEIVVIVLFFEKYIKDIEVIRSATLLKKDFIYFEAINNILKKIGTFNEKITDFWANMSYLYYYTGVYTKAELLLLKVIKIRERILGENHPHTGASYNLLALIYQKIGEYQKAEQFYLKASNLIKKLLGENNSSTVASYHNLATLYEKIGDYQKAERFYLKALKIQEELLGKWHIDTTEIYNSLAVLHQIKGEYKKAEYIFLKILKIKENILGVEHLDTGLSYNNLATLYDKMGEYKKEQSLLIKALEIYKKILGEEHPDTAIHYSNLASFYDTIGEYKKAESLYLRALNILGEESPDTAILYNNLVTCYKLMGEYIKAKKLSLKALKIIKKTLGEEHPNTAILYNTLASIYHSIGEYEKEKSLYLKALKIQEKELGEEHLDTTSSYNNLALFYQSTKEYEKAKIFFIKALKIRKKILGEEDSYTATSYNNLALLYFTIEEYKLAEPLFLKSLKIRNNIWKEEHPDIGQSYNNLASLYTSMGKYEKAKDLYLKSLEIYKKILGNNHPDTVASYGNLGLLYQSTGEYEKAEKLFLIILEIRENLLGKEHPSTASSYHYLAHLYQLSKKYEEAEKLYLKALKIRENLLGNRHSDTTISYYNLAGFYELINKYEKARFFYEKVLNIWKEEHPFSAQSYNNLAILYSYQKDFKKACRYMEKAIELWSKVSPKNREDLINAKEGLAIFEDELNSIDIFQSSIEFKLNLKESIKSSETIKYHHTGCYDIKNIYSVSSYNYEYSTIIKKEKK